MTGKTRLIERKIAAARAALVVERLWSALLWPMVVAGGALVLVFSGLLPRLPDLLRYGLLAVAVVVFVLACRPLLGLRRVRRTDAIGRIERASALVHHPVATLDDDLAAGTASPETRALWQEHRLRQLQQLDKLQVGPPRSDWPQRDPFALRVPVTLLLLASLALGLGGAGGNLRDSLRLAPRAAVAAMSVDAWLKPPPYTGKPPILLTSPAMAEKLARDPETLVPENAVLSVRAEGLAAPSLQLLPLDGGDKAAPLTDVAVKHKATEGGFQAEATLSRPLLARLMDGSRAVASWRIATIPDAAPTIAVRDTPAGDASGTLAVKWRAADDYGVTGIESEISLSDTQEDGLGFASSGVFLYDAPKVPVRLRAAAPKQEDGTTSADLAAHPWAGLMVEIVLTARDAAGHTTASAPVRFKLPERLFLKPLARALVEQRKQLILDPDNGPAVAKLLRALLVYPHGLIARSGTHIAIAAVVSRLDNAQSTDDTAEAVVALWQIAVAVEDGAAADAKAELEALRRELEKALAEGASPERLKELTDRMREALDRYMQSLAEEIRNAPPVPGANAQGRTVTPDELRKMLDDIGKLAQSGARDAARQMLSQLDDILRNLKPDSGGQQGDGSDQAMGKMLDQLGDVMRKQQKLMDDTQRMPQPGEDGAMDAPGQSGQGETPSGAPDALGDRQQGLGQSLEEFMGEIGRNGLKGPPSLGEAGRAMRNAERALRRGDQQGALSEQGQAMSKMRDGLRDMLRQMQQQAQGRGQSPGGTSGRGDDRDPLGRPRASYGEDFGPDRDMLPTERAMRRAQEILDQLRARSNAPSLPRLERDYIDRLLRGLY